VYPDSNSFYCFGCSSGGDVITFVRRIENLDYVDAVKMLADRAGLRMPEQGVNDAVSKLRMRVLEANREAARFYHRMLSDPAGREGLAYFRSRGYTDGTIRHFGLGYAPATGWALRDALKQKGFTDEELIAAWLCKRSQRGHLYDVFRGRVMVPIIDIRGNVIAFGGRVLDDSKPKYINTSDTLVYKKTDNLFALNFAKSALGKMPDGGTQLILCEGYMDVIALHQAGFQNAVAALGTSFTAEHARLIARYATEAVLTFDADAAGQKGTGRAIDLLRESGVRIKVVRVPEGKDPDEFIKKNGAERFRLLMERSANDVEYRLLELGRQFDLTSADGQSRYSQAAAELLAGLQSPIERDVYAGKIASEIGVTKTALLDQIRQVSRKQARRQEKRQLSEAVKQSAANVKKVNPEAETYWRAARAEEALLGLLIRNPDYIPKVEEALPPDQMVTPFNRRLYEQILSRHRSALLVELALLSADYDVDGMAYITRMVHAAAERDNTPDEALHCAAVIREEKRQLAVREGTPSDADIAEYLKKLRENKK
ncbi:MAG: DNA primase, partial [Clostridia bacterium]|nr:DNA primase [Clostridia bacterium]